jgi:hypothetical protein
MSSECAHGLHPPGGMIDVMDERHEIALGKAATKYQRAKDAYKAAGEELAAAVRAAYADGEQQSAILKAIKMVWSREYIRIVLGLVKKRGESTE